MIYKWVLAIGGTVFVAFALLQINDFEQYGNGDVWSWIVIYLIAAALSFYMLLRTLSRGVLMAWLGFTLGALLFRLQDDSGNYHWDRLNPATFWNERTATMVQQSNESGGLMLLLIWALVLLYLQSRVSAQ